MLCYPNTSFWGDVVLVEEDAGQTPRPSPVQLGQPASPVVTGACGASCPDPWDLCRLGSSKM